MQRDLEAALVGGAQRGVDRGRGRSPVLVHLVRRRRRPSACSARPAAETVLPLPISSTLTGSGSRARCTVRRCHGPGVTVVALEPSDGPVPPPPIVVIPVASASCDLASATAGGRARRCPGGEDLALAGDHVGRRPDHQVGVDAVRDVGVAGAAERDDPPVAQADVGLHDAPVVEDDRVGDDGVEGALARGWRRLRHRLADRLAAAEDRLLAADREVLARPRSTGRCRRGGPGRRPSGRRARRTRSREISTTAVSDLADLDARAPATPAERHDATSRDAPGSKRCDVPDGTSSRKPVGRLAVEARARCSRRGRWRCEPICTGRSPVLTTTSAAALLGRAVGVELDRAGATRIAPGPVGGGRTSRGPVQGSGGGG